MKRLWPTTSWQKLVCSCFNNFQNYIFIFDWCVVTVVWNHGESRTIRTPLLRDQKISPEEDETLTSAALRRPNVPSGTQRASGTDRRWHGKPNRRNLGLSLHTPPRLAGNGLANPRMFSWEALKGSETPTPPDSRGRFPLRRKMLSRFFIFRKALCDGPSHNEEGKGERRTSSGEQEEEELPGVPPVGIWQVMRGGTLLIYPHREKTSCWYRWHQDLFFPPLVPFSLCSSITPEHFRFCGGKVVLFIFCLHLFIFRLFI